VAYHAGKIGQETRVENEEFFESKKGTLLGIKWYHWFWFPFPIHMTGLLVTYSVYQIVFFLGGILRSLLWFMLIGFVIQPLLVGALYLLGFSFYKTYMLLATGFEMGLTRRQIVLRILWWTVGVYLVVSGMQTLANFLIR